MAQTGYTPILIYSSSTTTNAPAVGNLTNSTLGSELAINITDGKLFYKDNANAIQVIGWKTTPTTAGGTGLTSYTAGDLLYYATGTTLSKLAIGAANTVLTSSGSAPQWSTSLTLSGNVSAAALIPSGSTVPTNGWYLPSANVVAIANNSGFTANFDASRNFNLGQATSALQSGGTGITIYGSSFAEIKFLNSTTGTAATDGTAFVNSGLGFAINNREAGSLTLGTSNTVRLSIDSGGDITASTGNLIIGTSGKGIDFSATPGTGTSELLADYEEGTFTPTLVYSGTNTPTYASQLGRYTKIGRVVQIQIYLAWNENGSTGNVTLGSLPFTSLTSNCRAVPSILSYGLTGLPANISVTGFVNSNATTVSLFLNDNAATALSATYTDNDQDMYVTVTYEAA